MKQLILIVFLILLLIYLTIAFVLAWASERGQVKETQNAVTTETSAAEEFHIQLTAQATMVSP